MKEATIKLMLWPEPKEDNTYPIVFRIYKNGLRNYITTSYKTNSIQEEYCTGEVVEWIESSYPNSKHFNNFLVRELSDIQDFCVDQEKKNPHLSSAELKRRWENRNVQDIKEVLTFEDACKLYIDFLNNVGVPDHKRKERTQHHKDEVERFFKYAKEIIKPVSLLSEVNDYLVGKLYKHILITKDFEPSTYNKYMGLMNTLFDFHKVNPNPFKGIRYLDDENDETEAADVNEFYQMLDIVRPENGMAEYDDKDRNRYFDGCKEGFELFLMTGRRREEVLTLKWNDIYKENGEPIFIKAEDLKADRIKGKHEKEKPKFIRIPITAQLKDLLNRLQYEKYKNSDAYILHPESKTSRKVLMDKYSRAFSHFWKRLYPGSGITLMNLRKTYMTYLIMLLEDNAPKISGHSGLAVMNKHYKDKDLIAKTAKELKMGK